MSNDDANHEFRAWIERETRPRTTFADVKPKTAIIGRNTNPAHQAFDDQLRSMAGRGSYTQDAFTGREIKEPAPAPAPPDAAEAAALAAGLPAGSGSFLTGKTSAELADSARQLADWRARQ